MNPPEDEIENTLRHVPRPVPTPGLRQQLINQIPAAGAARSGETTNGRARPAWLLRWWPALGLGSLAAVSLVVLGVQQAEVAELRRAIEVLSQPTAQTAAASAAIGPSDPVPATVPTEDGAAELARLRAAVAVLTQQVATLEALGVENQRLQQQLANPTTPDGEVLQELEKAREKAQRIACINNMKQMGLAARVWATDNDDVLPPDILSMTNELVTPKILICPADTTRTVATGWGEFGAGNVSYEFLAPSASETEPTRVAFRCPIHGSVTLVDGSVQQLEPQSPRLTNVNGKLYLGAPVAASPSSTVRQPGAGMDARMRERYGLKPADVDPGANTGPSQP